MGSIESKNRINEIKELLKNDSEFCFICLERDCKTRWPHNTGYTCPTCNTVNDQAESNYQLNGLIK